MKFFELRVEIFLAEKKPRWVEGGGRILVGDNTSGGSVVLRPIKFQGAGVLI
jgi:hypothetical protein